MSYIRAKQADGTIAKVPLGGSAKGAVRYDQTQVLTEAQKSQARNNIGAISDNITLGVHSDGLVYIFVDSQPMGEGISMSAASEIYGYVADDGTIVVKGDLADGEYTVKYEIDNEDGTVTTIDIGDLVLDNTVYYSITKNLTNCTLSNSATQVAKGESYSATITANDGYELTSVVVTMGGNAVGVSGGVIGIPSVTGDIVIEAVATEIEPDPEPIEPTNFAVPNTTNKTDWSIWCNDARFGSDGGYRALAGNVVTNYVAMEVGDIIRFTGLNVPTTGTSMYQGLHFSDADKALLSCSYLSWYMEQGYLDITVTDGVYEVDTAKLVNHPRAGASKFFRISGGLTGTVNDVVINVKRNGAWL